MMNSASATVVTPAYNFTENTVATLSMHDPTINCDMVAEYNGVYIKGIVYGDAPTGGGYQSYLYAEDGYGHTDTYTLPTGAAHPDIAMGCRDAGPSIGLLYQATVTYTIGTYLYVDVYDLSAVGYSSFSISSRLKHELISSSCSQFPHIDMWGDYGGPGGVPFLIDRLSMHQFAVVYSATNGNLNGYVNDLNSWNTSASSFPIYVSGGSGTQVSNSSFPDVACQVDGSYHQVFHVAYEGSAPFSSGSVYMPLVGGTGVKQLTYDYTSTATTTSPVSCFSGKSYAPRIEAMAYFDLGTSSNPECQVVFSAKAYASGYDQVLSWNPAYGGDIPSPQDFNNPFNCMSACVAAGADVNNPLYPNIGNLQYTVGFYPWGKSGGATPSPYNHVYERQIDYSTGTFFNTNTFQASTTPVNFYWDINRNMAISNTSNYGADILSAWYNGTDIVWKLSTPDVMAFRQAAVANSGKGLEVSLSLAPMPAADAIRINGLNAETSYSVTDITGRVLIQGRTGPGQAINLAALPQGHYALKFSVEQQPARSLPFAKQ